MHSFLVPVLGSLFVSFRPSLIRFPQLFLRCFPSAFAFGLFRFPSGSFRLLLFCLRLLGRLFFLSASSCLRLTVASSVLRLRSRFPGLPRSFLPGFPCFLSRFFVLGFCSFPFILPGFAPTAVPPVLPFFSASSRPLLFRAFRLLSAFFRLLLLASDYSAFRSFFSLLPVLPCRRFLRCSPVPFVPFAFLFRPACVHAFHPIPVLSFLRFLSPLLCFVSQALRSSWPPVSSSANPFAFALGFGYSACLF